MFDFLYLFKDCKNYEKSYVNLRAKKGFIDEFNKSLYFMAILCLIQFVYYEKTAWVLSKLCYLAQPTAATYGVPLSERIQGVVCAGAGYITILTSNFERFGCFVAPSLVSIAPSWYPSPCRGLHNYSYIDFREIWVFRCSVAGLHNFLTSSSVNSCFLDVILSSFPS